MIIFLHYRHYDIADRLRTSSEICQRAKLSERSETFVPCDLCRIRTTLCTLNPRIHTNLLQTLINKHYQTVENQRKDKKIRQYNFYSKDCIKE